MTNKDLEFLTQLDKKLHTLERVKGSGPWRSKEFYVDNYTSEKMTKEEIVNDYGHYDY